MPLGNASGCFVCFCERELNRDPYIIHLATWRSFKEPCSTSLELAREANRLGLSDSAPRNATFSVSGVAVVGLV